MRYLNLKNPLQRFNSMRAAQILAIAPIPVSTLFAAGTDL